MDRNLADTKSKAQSMIMAGQVYVNDKIITKSGNSFNENSRIKIKQLHPPWAVSYTHLTLPTMIRV